MEDFNLIVKELISKETEVRIPETLIPKLEETAENYLKKEQIIDAIKVFILTKNKKKLITLGKKAIEETKLEVAFLALKNTENLEEINNLANAFMKQNQLKLALECFKLAQNKEMIEFLVENF